MQPIEYYLEHAGELALKVVDAWEVNPRTGNTEFQDVFDKASQYLVAKRVEDKRRGQKDLERPDAVEEGATRLAFAKAYKNFEERRQAAGA